MVSPGPTRRRCSLAVLSSPTSQATLWDPLGEPRGRGSLLRAWEDGGWVSWSWDEWRDRALRFAAGLRRIGVAPEDRVAGLLTNSHRGCAAVIGTWLAGGCLISMPTMARGMAPERYLEQLRRIIEQAEPRVLLADAAFGSMLSQAELGAAFRSFDQVDGPAGFEPALPADDQAIFVQYSSGSTSDPHGCVLSAGAIARQLSMLEHTVGLDAAEDTCVSWLPLSHDMGLFGGLLLHAYWTGTELALSNPQRFVTNPRSWFGDCARVGATITLGPNFALDVAARTAAGLPPASTPVRRVVIGGERVDPDTLDKALGALGPDRLMDGALLPAYGLAEAVLAVTTTALGEGPTVITVDREQLARGAVRPLGGTEQPGGTRLAASGQPMPGIDVTIRGERDVGEICVRTPSLAEGYLGSPELTGRKFTPGGLLTGDLGFMLDGRLFVTGRIDDLMTIAGRNVYARDIEAAILATGHCRPGCCAVVPRGPGPEGPLVAVIEPVEHHAPSAEIAYEIGAVAREVAAVRIVECLLLARGLFPKTPSGKIQRFRCQELAADPGFTAGERVRVGGRRPG